MTAAVIGLAAHVAEVVDEAERKFYGPNAKMAEANERRERIHLMTRQGMSARQIAAVEGIAQRNVVRHRAMSVPDNVVPLPPPADDITEARAAELEVAADLVIDLAVRLQEENPLLTWDVLSRMDRWQLQELMVLLLATVRLDATKSELFAWVLDLPAAQEDQL